MRKRHSIPRRHPLPRAAHTACARPPLAGALLLLLLFFSSSRLIPLEACAESGTDPLPPYYRPLSEIVSDGGKHPPVQGNSMQYYNSGEDFFRALEESILGAGEYIHIQTYKFSADSVGLKILSLLKLKALEGVEVLLLYDGTCEVYQPVHFYREMATYGIRAVPFNIVTGTGYVNVKPSDLFSRADTRDHRKIIAIDGKTAFCGGMNITEDYLDFKDTHMRLEGPVVDELEKVFEEAWTYVTDGSMPRPADFYRGKCTPVPGGITAQIARVDVEGRWSTMKEALSWIFDNARTEIRIETPYFGMDEVLIRKLGEAALRGVKVDLMLPAAVDVFNLGIDVLNRLDLPYLRDSGVNIYLYKESRFNHTKLLLCDGQVSMLGSCNMDERSLRRNYEASVLMYGEETAARVADIFEGDLASCRKFTEEDLTGNRYYRRPFLRAIARALRTLF